MSDEFVEVGDGTRWKRWWFASWCSFPLAGDDTHMRVVDSCVFIVHTAWHAERNREVPAR